MFGCAGSSLLHDFSLVAMYRLLIVVLLVAQHGLWVHRLQLLRLWGSRA